MKKAFVAQFISRLEKISKILGQERALELEKFRPL